ncbi:hypothetical protein K4L44_16385 [Halosquirtibacter laminarini]|uniref:Uncharacterized protein n=1 Tax=Halosquirtibacter laminarini TaxID=3374600 RepID=A0AC61NIJ3_9BACT|nr:hypothetical protein K4L44_16385 [Prolixibacteraceae bacterium]
MPRVLLIIIVTIFFLSSCKKEETPSHQQYQETLLVYMIADNDLYNEAFLDSYQIAQGLNKGQKVVVYIDAGQGNAKLYELNQPNMSSIQNHIVKMYSHDDSANPKVIYETLQEMIRLYPSQNYDLILWSHSNAWFPNIPTRTKSFGYDRGTTINIDKLVSALPIKFRTILFDSCLMGSIEVISELQHNAEYIVAAPTNVLKEGFYYRDMIPKLLNEKAPIQQRLIDACQQYIDHYTNQIEPSQQSASISIYQTAYIPEVEQAFQSIRNHRKEVITSENVLQLDNVYKCYDFHDMLKKNYSPQDYEKVKSSLKRLIVFHDHTDWFLSKIELERSNGISCYIPTRNDNQYFSYYQTLSWSKHSEYNQAIFP